MLGDDQNAGTVSLTTKESAKKSGKKKIPVKLLKQSKDSVEKVGNHCSYDTKHGNKVIWNHPKYLSLE